MGSLYQGAPPPKIQDLKITIHDSSLVFPCQETKKQSIFLSNIDKVLNFNVETVHFFPGRQDFQFTAVVERTKAALAKILVPYDFLAGRLKLNAETGRLELDCNVAGAGFVVASSEYTLDDFGDLVFPNPAFAQLIVTNLDFLEPHDQPLCMLQSRGDRGGGVVLGSNVGQGSLVCGGVGRLEEGGLGFWGGSATVGFAGVEENGVNLGSQVQSN